MTGFVISDVTVAETSTGVRLSARVRGGDGWPPSLWFEVPPTFAEALSARGDPRNIARYPAGDARLISHLVLLHGFDVSFQDAGVRAPLPSAAGRGRERSGPVRRSWD